MSLPQIYNLLLWGAAVVLLGAILVFLFQGKDALKKPLESIKKTIKKIKAWTKEHPILTVLAIIVGAALGAGLFAIGAVGLVGASVATMAVAVGGVGLGNSLVPIVSSCPPGSTICANVGGGTVG